MVEYIERNALIAEFKRLTLGENSLVERLFADGVYAVIETFPAADVAEVRHAKWKYFHKQNKAVCTSCSFERDLDTDFGRAIACPNCGTRMDKEDET